MRQPLAVETLEERTLLNAVSWINPGSGFWDDPANWFDANTSTNHVPGGGDDVVISQATDLTVTVRDFRVVNSLNNHEAIDVQAGATLQMQAASQLHGSLTSNGGLNLFGTLTIEPTGVLIWQSGGLTGSLTNNGSLTIAGNNDKALSASIVNNAMIAQQGSGRVLDTASGQGSRIDNNVGATYDFVGDGGTQEVSNFNNQGTVLRSSGAGESRFTRNFNNQGGTIEVRQGALNLAGGGQSTGGVFNALLDAALRITGTLDFTGTYTGSGAGHVNFEGHIRSFDVGPTFNLDAALLQWISGQISTGNPFRNAGQFNIVGDLDKNLSGYIINTGTIVHSGAGRVIDVASGGGSRLDNEAGAVYDLIGTSTQEVATFNNLGTLRRSTGAGEAQFTRNFNNQNGVIDVLHGTINLAGGGLNTHGTFNASNDGVLKLTGFLGFTGSFTGAGDGKVEIAGGNVVSVDAGVPGGHANFNFPEGLLHWSGGSIGGGGCGSGFGCTQAFFNDAFMTLDPALSIALGGSGFINTGTMVNVGPGEFNMNGQVFENRQGAIFEQRGDYDIRGTDQFGNPGRFINAGILRKSAGDDSTDVTARLENAATGEIEVLSGTLNFLRGGNSTGGMFDLAPGATVKLNGNDVYGWAGSYTSSATGRIELTSLLNGSDGLNPATLNFPTGVFHYLSGQLLGSIVNNGELNIDGTGYFVRAGITNNGTVVQSGAGDLGLNANTGIVNNGLWDFRSDSDLVVVNDASIGPVRFTNFGTLRKSDGLGTTALRHDGSSRSLQLDNRGMVEARSGTLSIDDQVIQSNSNALNGGSWKAGAFSTLVFPGGTNITTNNADITLEGTNSTFAAINNLATNQGSFTLTGGRDFNTVGNFTNTGELTVGPGSILTVNGQYNQPTTANTLLGWWRGDGDAMSSAGTIHGTINGAVDFAQGQFNQGFNFTGDGVVNLGTPGTLGGATFTIAAWVKRNSTATGGPIFGYQFNAANFRVLNDGRLSLSTLSGTVESTNLRINDTALHHVAVAKLGGRVTFFLDGVAEASLPLSTTAALPSGLAAGIGGQPDNQAFHFDGLIDEVTFFTRALDTADIQSLMAANNAAQLAPLVPKLAIQIGDRPNTDQFGQVNSTGAANLSGELNVQLIGGFGPHTGDVYEVMHYASKSGDFAQFTGAAGSFFVDSQPSKVVLTTTAPTPIDLDVDAFSIPAGGMAGANITINYTVSNLANDASFGSWTDSIYLSKDITYSPDDLLIGRVTHLGGVAALGQYGESLTAPLPGVIDGNYHVIVLANSRGEIPETDRGNNFGASTNTIQVGIPSLTFGTTTNATITNGQDLYFKLDVPAGGDVVFNLNFSAPLQAEFLVRYRQLPDRTNFDFSAPNLLELQRQLTLMSPQAGPYYVLVHGREGAGGQGFDILPQHIALAVQGVSPNHGSNRGFVTVLVQGAGFTDKTVVRLVRGNTVRTAAEVLVRDPNSMFVLFDLRGLATGEYAIRTEQGNQIIDTPAAFTVNAGSFGQLSTNVRHPAAIRAGSEATIYIDYANTGETNIPAPLYIVQAHGAKLRLAEQDSFREDLLPVMGINRDGPAGVLPPGARGTIKIIANPNGGLFTDEFHLALASGSDTIDWNSLKDRLRPDTVVPEAWEAIFANFLADVGTTTGSFQTALDNVATYLSQQGIYTNDADRLMRYLFLLADGFGSISTRYQMSEYGRGRPAPAGIITATETADGDVTINYGGAFRFFLKSGAGYVGLGLDHGILVKVGDHFELRETHGTTISFRSDGKWDFTEDRNGRRIIAGYTGNRLTTVTDPDGDATTYHYNAQGLVDRTTDPVGREVTFAYDGAGRLLSMSGPTGTTSMTYVTGQGAAREHAVASITHLDGTHAFFEYDARGRLTRQSLDGGALATTYSYDIFGRVTVTGRDGRMLVVSPNEFALSGQTVDEHGQVTRYNFDKAGQETSIIAPGGLTTKLTYDAQGSPTSGTDPLGRTFGIAFGDQDELRTFRDPLGNTTQVEYDANGNPARTTFADGSTEQLTYDAAGRVLTATTAGGVVFSYTYSASGRLLREDASDGSFIEYTYDSHRNLKTAANAAGTTSFDYDAADRLIKVTYPSGKFVSFGYDSVGRRSLITDSSGFTLRYAYDALGRLRSVNNAADQELTTYFYDAAGRITRRTMGNGAVADYEYDADGRFRTLTNKGIGGAVISRYEYHYDDIGQITSVVTLEGTTNYGYDATGQLTSVELPDGRTITYEYDAAGNRIAVRDSNAADTNYAVNNLNQYTTAGAATFTYNPDGAMTSKVDASGTTTYNYDARGRLISVVTPTDTFAYEYDALGNRIATIKNGNRTEQLVDPTGLGNVVAEYDDLGAVQAHYALGVGLAARFDASGAAQFYHFDGSGNASELTGAGGAVSDSYTYLPFGEKRSATGTTANPYTFAARDGVMDDGNGLYYMRARWFDPVTGRFVQADPAGLEGGDVNLYTYVGNNPVPYTDPTGLNEPPQPGQLGRCGQVVRTSEVGNAGASTPKPVPPQTKTTTGGNPTYDQIKAAQEAANAKVAQYEASKPSGAPLTPEERIELGLDKPKPQPEPAPKPVKQPYKLPEVEGPQAPYTMGKGGKVIDRTVPDGLPPPKTASPLKLAGGAVGGAGGVVLMSDPAVQTYADLLIPDLRPGNGSPFGPAAQSRPDVRDARDDAFKEDAKKILTDQDLCELLAGALSGAITTAALVAAAPSLGGSLAIGAAGGAAVYTLFAALCWDIGGLFSSDPNNIIGPAGIGADRFMQPDQDMNYTINFQNKPEATAPALQVVITQQLDADLDWSTFELGDFGFGDIVVSVPAGRSSYQTRIDLPASARTGGEPLIVEVSAGINFTTGLITWTFSTLDPTTGDVPINPFAGFLPPDVTPGEGAGFVNYTVRSKAELSTGTQIRAEARIVFDANDPIDTDPWINTIDNGDPTSSMTALPAQTTQTTFNVNWGGADDVGGVGIAFYHVFVSDNDGPFTLFKHYTPSTSALFSGQVGHTYRFYSVAADGVAHQEPVERTAQASIQVVASTNVKFNKPKTYVVGVNSRLLVSALIGLLNQPHDRGTRLRLVPGSVSGVPAGHVLRVNRDGSFAFKPRRNFVGEVRFTYQLTDGRDVSGPILVKLQVGGRSFGRGR